MLNKSNIINLIMNYLALIIYIVLSGAFGVYS